MAKLVIFCGPQLSGKTTLAKQLSKKLKIPFLSIDDIRLKLYGRLTGPRDWKTPEIKKRENKKTKLAYDCLFLIIEKCLEAGASLVIEMPYIGQREERLIEILDHNKTQLKIIWCQILGNKTEEIAKRSRQRKQDPNSAPISITDYQMFKEKIIEPSLPCLIVDTSRSIKFCLQQIQNYIKKPR